MSTNSKYYNENIKNISEIQFCLYTNDMIKKNSAVRSDPFGINVPDSYDNYEPKKGGLVDLRLGSCDIYLNCTTCGLNSLECPGHFGHTELAEPVFHYGFLNHLIAVLKCICHKCSNILIERSDDNMKRFNNKSGKNRFKELKELSKNINYCSHCGTPIPKIKKEVKETSTSIRILLEKEVGNTMIDEKTGVSTDMVKIIKDYLSPRQCYYLLRNISDIDAYMIGFNTQDARPEDLIIIRFPIPPVIIRPTAKIDFLAAANMEDSLTLKIADIITWNTRIRNETNKESNTFNDAHTLLQFHIATYFDNDSASLPKSEFKTGNRPTTSISDRIKGKEGRMRMNIMGKRVDFSARSVITSDPYIDIDMVGVPLKIAKDLTIPEEVTPNNIKHLNVLIKNGRNIYPGANYVFKNTIINGKQVQHKIDLRYRKANLKLSLGDIVERHVINGDYVLFNRQPTFHKPSMMGHKVQILNRNDVNTFRMNVSVCGPYNADFDGDEMNIHLAQSIQARNELERIANVKYQIIGGKDSNPIIGCVQDTISGAYMLSVDTNIPYDIAANILCNTSSVIKNKKPILLKKGESITGRELFSYIIPDGINSKKKNFHVMNGKLIEGNLDKSQLSKKRNSLIHYIWDKYGPTYTQQFIDDTQRLILNYLLNKGFTVGIKDCIIDNTMIKQIKEIIHTKILATNNMITMFENDKDKITPEIGETIILMNLNSIGSNISKMILESLSKDNAFNIMIALSEAKGTKTNMSQIAGCYGQSTVEDKRIKKRIAGRTLPFFHQNDDTPKARGFVSSNLLNGFKGHEFFFHTMNGREGLIDTAIKSVTGDTMIIIIEDNVTKQVSIGDWIDSYLSANKDIIEHYTDRNMELIRLKNNVYIPTTDNVGNVSWGEITAITRHDPGDALYEIITEGGRKVIVTESKSLLIWNESSKEFERMSTPDVRVGNYVPVTINLEKPIYTIDQIEMSKYIPTSNDIFQLTSNNGIYIGIFLGQGIINNNNINIVNYNTSVKNFINQWYTDLGIKYNIYAGATSAIYSKFLLQFTGSNVYDRYIPNEAFISNNEFIVGILNGYISSCGIIENNMIQLISLSNKLINGLSMLLNRIGIYSSISNNNKEYILTIENKWVLLLHDMIQYYGNLIDNIKQIKLDTINEILSIKEYDNMKQIGDVMLDKIITINIIDKETTMKKYPKVYDLTIPSTLNFGLANGLHVVDTAETGYIQRKLVKSLEDMYINYEGMIRTANGVLVQYLYGDSGIDQQRQTQNSINLINYNNTDIKKLFVFTKSEINDIMIDKYDNDMMYNTMIDFRNKLRNIYFKSTSNYKVISEHFMLPVNLLRITQEYKSIMTTIKNIKNDLKPVYIIEMLEDLINNYDDRLVTIMKKDSILLKQDNTAFKTIFTIALYEYIGPKKCIIDYKLNKEYFDKMILDIKIAYTRSIAEPGEMVGVIAAQSIGEPTSQMTLNTKHSAGVAGKGSANMGVGRIKELLSYSKSIKTPQMTIYFKEPYNTNKADVNIIESYLKHLTIGELVDKAEILYSMEGNDDISQIITSDNTSNPFYTTTDKTKIDMMPFIIRLKMNLEKMMDKETTLLDIKTKFITYWYKHFSNLKNVRKGLKDTLSYVDKIAILSNNDNIIHIRFKMSNFDYKILTNFLSIILNTITLKGIDYINNISQLHERRILFNDEGEPNVSKEYVVVTDGINNEGILTIKGIDHSRTKINNIETIYKHYGIEAARKIIIDELLLTFSAGGSDNLNHAHIALLVDLMTYSGEVISIDRHGLNKVDNDPLSRASFEKTMEHFVNAALFSETDKLKSVSSRIAIGRVIPGGTGAFDIMIDTDKLKNSEYIENETGGRTNFILLEQDPLFQDIIIYGFIDHNLFIPKN